MHLRGGAPTTAAELAAAVTHISLDPASCYRVTDLNFSKEDVRIYLTSGYISFAKEIHGRTIGAVFTTDIEAGDAEILLLPPYRGERLSLANFTGSPNLDEHFKAAVMIFTDSTGAELESALQSHDARKNAEIGALFAERWTPPLRNLAGSFQVQVVGDLLSAPSNSGASNPSASGPGMFYMGVAGSKLGNFDVLYDPRGSDQIAIGQMAYRDGQPYFNMWSSFPGKKKRSAPEAETQPPLAIDNYRIDATIRPDLLVSASTQATLTLHGATGRALPFWISSAMRVNAVSIDGQPAEVFQRVSLRSNLIRGGGNEEFLVVPPAPLDASKPHKIEFHHEGEVISTAGDRVFFVSSRGTWYPRLSSAFAHFDLTFRYPRDLVLVCTGDPVSTRTEGESRISDFHAPAPIRFAGFNLGAYNCVSRERGGLKVDVCANREIEAALRRQPVPNEHIALTPAQAVARGRRPFLDPAPLAPQPNPAARLDKLADDVAGALEYMSAQFGPPPIRRVTVSPIPGSFGQGFPGLIYLSTLSYMDASQRPAAARNTYKDLLFSDVLEAHEAAHQWWGNLVTAAGYQDEWLMESLADYSALLYLEKKSGPRALDAVLDRYRDDLLKKTDSGRTVESAGPIVWGVRLLSSQAPQSWRAITYEKGAWILHMLRRRLGDARFTAMLREICAQYHYRAISTEEFREIARRFSPPKSPDPELRTFFDNWVYGTGIPAVKITQSSRAGKITGILTASGAGDDFTGFIPVEVQQGRKKSVYWLQASSEGSSFSIPLRPPAAGTKVSPAFNDSLIKK